MTAVLTGARITPVSTAGVPAGLRAVKYPSRAHAADDGKMYLHPGEFAVGGAPCTITTILGSCVSVCLHDPVARLGGLNHFLLPSAPANTPSLRFGDVALQQLVSVLESHGAQRNRLSATVVGGACVLDAYRGMAEHIGRQNVSAALRVLNEMRIHVSSLEVWGARARKVRYRPDTGYLLVSLI
jgi:chemotaxis protein CheD